MTKPASSSRALPALLLTLICVLPGLAQGVRPAAPASAPKDAAPAPRQVPVEEVSEDEEDVVQLAPFTVEAATDRGYQATSTLAGTRLRTELRDVGAAISVVNAQFLADTASTNAKDVLVYTTGTEAAGMGGNYSGTTGGQGFSNPEDGLVSPNSMTRVRGLSGADLTRDFFSTDIGMDSYNTERIDISRGANAILFGLGSPAGIINNQLKAPNLRKNGYTFTSAVSRYESHREVLDVNQVLRRDELGLRVVGLNDERKFRQEPAFEDDRRLYASLRWEPRLVKDGLTQIQVSYEDGEIEANRPRVNPPADGLTVWFDVLGKVALDPTQTTNVTTNPLLAAHLGSAGRWFGQVGAVFTDPASAAQGGNGVPPFMMSRGGTPNFTQWYGVYNYTAAGNNPNFFLNRIFAPPGEAYAGLWRYQEIRDPSVYNFYDKLLDGPNKREFADFQAFNAVARQTFFRDALGLEVAYDRQEHSRRNRSLIGFDAAMIHVDMQTRLVDGSPNPNFGRPYFASDSIGNYMVDTDREAFRATAYATADLTGKKSWLRHLGRHVLTGVYSDQEMDRLSRTHQGYAYALDQNVYADSPSATSYPGYAAIHYLGGSIAGLSSPAGANVSNLTALHEPLPTGTALLFDNRTDTWVRVPVSVITPERDLDKLYSNANRSLSKTKSYSAIWQSYLFNRKLVGIVGWREDEFALRDAGPPRTVPVTGQVNPFDPAWTYPSVPNIAAKDRTVSWSVVGHSPDFIKRRLPRGMDVSVSYNESENFRPSSTVADVYGRPFSPPAGSTKDYGVTLSFADNKFVVRAIRYETRQANDVATFYNTFWPGNDIVRAMNGLRGTNTSEVLINRWFGFKPGDANYLPLRAGLTNTTQANPGLTTAERTARDAWFAARTDAEWLRPVDPLLVQTWNISRSGGSWTATRPPNVGNIADTESSGYEFEATYNPLPHWRLTLNAAMQEAVRSNYGKDFEAFIKANLPVWTDGDGIIAASIRDQNGFEDIPYFNSVTGSRLGVMAINNMYVPYLNALAANSSSVQELRKWRFNFVTTYDFRSGPLQGFSVGGAARWQDRSAIGYGVKKNEIGAWVSDVTKPFYGSEELDVDLWLRYTRKLLSGKVRWSVQLNVRDVFGNDDLIAIVAQPNGQTASARIPSPQVWTLTNTFAF
jgi:outer membrane receptor protein involved in Fe transport